MNNFSSKNKFTSVLTVLFISIFFSATTAVSAANSDLQYGISWFGKGNVSQKAVAGVNNPYYNPNKPTIIYAHGWQNGAIVRGSKETFNYKQNDSKYGINVNAADAWIDKGWNIGIFYWQEFADESEVRDAEAKIWSPNGPRGMRLRRTDGSYTTASLVNNKSVSMLMRESIQTAMPNYNGNNLRLAGHSLGNQLVIATSQLLKNDVISGNLSSNFLPERVALLDPFYSRDAKAYLNNRWNGEVARDYVRQLKNEGVYFEYYQTSATGQLGFIGVGDDNNGLKDLSAYTMVRPWYIGGLDVAAKHIAAPNLYFLSFGSAPPEEVTISWWRRRPTGQDAASASTSDSRIGDMMNNNYFWDQVEGRYTVNTDDDQFERKRK